MTVLLRGAEVLAPEPLGARDVLLGPDRVLAVTEPGALDGALGALQAEVLDCPGRLVAPGLVDGHVHLLGGGGGAGYASRIPELPPDALLEAGITACVGMPGVEALVRPLDALLARAYAVESSGLRAAVMAGGFRGPGDPLTGSLARDLYLLPHLVGVKVALVEHLGRPWRVGDLAALLSELEWASRATGKACLLHAHLGTAPGDRRDLLRALETSHAAPERVQVTHVNFTPENLRAAAELAAAGFWVDVNPLINPRRIAGAVDPVDAVLELLDRGVPLGRITMSSDGNASVPRDLPSGERETFRFQLDLLPAVHRLVERGLDRSDALRLVTANPAAALRWDDQGVLAAGARADAVVLDEAFVVQHVVAGGRLVVREGTALEPSQFRDPRWR